MANESITSDNQVDMNNNNDQTDVKPHVNGNGTSDSDDSILKLKRIILEQDQENSTVKTSSNFVVKEVKETPKLVKNLMTNGTILGAFNSNDTTLTSPTTNCSSVPSLNRLNKSPVRSPNKSPQSEKKSLICQINKSPTPNRKIINQNNIKLNNNEPDESCIKETIDKMNDKVMDRVNELSKVNLANNDLDESLIKSVETINVKSESVDELDKIEPVNKLNSIKNDSNKLDTVDNKVKSEQRSTSSKKSDNSETESIEIVQNKSINNNNSTIKIDSNNNVPADAVSETDQHSTNNRSDHKQTPDKSIGNSLPVQVKEKMTEIELIIRASNIDGKRKGADLFCQEYFMDLYLLAELNFIHLKISTVDLKKPPTNFRNKFSTTKPPILLGNEQLAILENEKIERYIMKNINGGHLLFVKDVEAAKLIENLYSKFKLALSRNESQTKQSLLRHLDAIDKHLAGRKTKFLTGDHVCCFDFELITKLQHIRIAGGYFIDDFEIPSCLTHLWKYMNRMYNLNAFIEASPDDQTIISHYLDSNSILINRTSLTKKKNRTHHLELQKPYISVSMPP